MMKNVLLAITTLSFVPCAAMADLNSSLVIEGEQALEAFAKHGHYMPNVKLVELQQISKVNLPKSSSSDDLTEDEARQVTACTAPQEKTDFLGTLKSWFSKVCSFVASFF